MLGLAYLWVGSVNGVQLQVWATWLYYAIPVDLCDDVAQALQVPLDRISVEMVARGLYHYVQATANGYNDSAMRYFAEHAKLLGILKRPKEPGGPSVLTQVSLAPQPDLARRPGTAWAPNCRSWQRRPRPIVAAHLGWEVTKLPLYAGEQLRGKLRILSQVFLRR